MTVWALGLGPRGSAGEDVLRPRACHRSGRGVSRAGIPWIGARPWARPWARPGSERLPRSAVQTGHFVSWGSSLRRNGADSRRIRAWFHLLARPRGRTQSPGGARALPGTACAGNCLKPDPAQRALWVGDPPPHLQISGRQSRPERRDVASDRPPHSAFFGDQEDRADGGGAPATLRGRNSRNHAGLEVELREQLLEVLETRLDFDDEQGSPIRLPSENIDRTPLAVSIERELGRSLPAGASKSRHRDLHQGSVAGVDEPVEVAASPLRGQRHPDSERAGNLADDAQ